jgi:hypothetical protein
MSAAQDLHDFERAQLDTHWLYRQGDLVLGPLTGHQLVEKLYTGVISGETEVSSSGPSGFRRLKEIDAFKLHVSKAAVKQKVEAEARALQARRTRQRLIAGGVAAVVLGALGFGAWQISRYAAVYMPDERITIEVDPPIITTAKRSAPEELFEYPGEPKRAPSVTKPSEPTEDNPPEKVADKTQDRTPDKSADKFSKPEKVAANMTLPKLGKTSTSRASGKVITDADGMSTEVNYDQASINRVVKTKQSSLFHCFKEEAERRPGFTAKVPLEFTIGNDGRVAQLWVDHPQLKKGPMYDCLLGELKKWPFKSYTGERATVNLSFTIGSKG